MKTLVKTMGDRSRIVDALKRMIGSIVRVVLREYILEYNICVCGFQVFFFLSSGGTGTLLGIDFLDIFTFGKSPLVRSKTSLGELVNTLVRSRSACLIISKIRFSYGDKPTTSRAIERHNLVSVDATYFVQ
jgi:hypothetical protein